MSSNSNDTTPYREYNIFENLCAPDNFNVDKTRGDGTSNIIKSQHHTIVENECTIKKSNIGHQNNLKRAHIEHMSSVYADSSDTVSTVLTLSNELKSEIKYTNLYPRKLPKLEIINPNNNNIKVVEMLPDIVRIDGRKLPELSSLIVNSSKINKDNMPISMIMSSQHDQLKSDNCNINSKTNRKDDLYMPYQGNIKYLMKKEAEYLKFKSVEEMINTYSNKKIELNDLLSSQKLLKNIPNNENFKDQPKDEKSPNHKLKFDMLPIKKIIKDLNNNKNFKFSKDAKEFFQSCLTEFVCCITKDILKNCKQLQKNSKKKIKITENDIINTFNRFGLENYSKVLNVFEININKKKCKSGHNKTPVEATCNVRDINKGSPSNNTS